MRAGAGSVALAALALVEGCSGVRVRDFATADVSATGLTDASSSALAEANDYLRNGVTSEHADPYRAIAAFRDAALSALPLAVAEGVSERPGPAQRIYRQAVESATLVAYRLAKKHKSSWIDELARAGIDVRGTPGALPAAAWTEALPTRVFAVSGFHRMIVRSGLGAPLVLKRVQVGSSKTPSKPQDRYYPDISFRAATAVLGPGAGAGRAVLELVDPVREPDMVRFGGGSNAPIPLAYDLTTPLARQLTSDNMSLIGPLGVLFPSSFNARSGLYLADPYEPGKIPVVLVHGLSSTPRAWSNALNELRGDPELRKRYQFWSFYYSTGNSILASSARLRKALYAVRREFDPDKADPAFEHTVLIGHSMGGLLSRLAICSTGLDLWNVASRLPPEQLSIDPEIKQQLMRALIFEPVPTATRVVFVSTPHEGSPLSYQLVGRLVSSLIRLPRAATELSAALVQAQGVDGVSAAFRDRRMMTGVAQLSPNNPVLQAMKRLTISPTVPFHSIVGFDGRGSLLEGGDGVVPYLSAHLEGALSELVVLSDHSAQERPASIEEMRRILNLHLDEYDADRQADLLGLPLQPRPTRPQGYTPIREDLRPFDRVDEAPVVRRLRR